MPGCAESRGPRNLLPLTGVALFVLALLLIAGDGHHTAQAYPGLTVAVDMKPSTNNDANNDGLYETVNLTTFERCIAVAVNAEIDIDVFVLDVADLVAFNGDLVYDGSIIKIIGAYTGTTPTNAPKMFLSTQAGSDVANSSQNDPNPPRAPWPRTTRMGTIRPPPSMPASPHLTATTAPAGSPASG